MPSAVLIQHTNSTANSQGYQTGKIKFPSPSPGGNLLVINTVAGNSAPTMTITDDQSNSWTSTTAISDGGNNQSMQAFYVKNCAASTQQVTVDYGSSLLNNQVMMSEWMNIDQSSPLDTQGGQVTSGGSLASGNITTTVDNDLILHWAGLDSWPAQTAPMTWTAGTNMTIFEPDPTTFMCGSFRHLAAHGTISPAVTSSISTSNNAIVKALAFKTASAGNDFSDKIRVRGRNYQAIENNGTFFTSSGSTFTYQAYISGNCALVGWTGIEDKKPTSSGFSSSPAATWKKTAASTEVGAGKNSSWWWYATNLSPGLYAITVTLTGSNPLASSVNILDTSGADGSDPLERYQGVANTNTSVPTPGNTAVYNGPTFTAGGGNAPTHTNAVLVAVSQEGQHTPTAHSPGKAVSIDYGVYASNGGETDGGCAVYHLPSTADISTTWTYSGYEAGVNGINDYTFQSAIFFGSDVLLGQGVM